MTRPPRRALHVAIFVALVALFGEGRALAHQRSVSHARWWLEGDVAHAELRVSQPDMELALAAARLSNDDSAGLREYVVSRFQLSVREGSGARACTVRADSFRALRTVPSELAWEWAVKCPRKIERAVVESRLFEEVLPHHLCFVRIASGSLSADEVLTDGHRSLSFDGARAEPNARITSFARLGVEHILTGFDHLVFLLALLMGASSLGGLVRVITGFTIGHSLTLAFAVLGWVHPTSALVEASIGISIVVVAVENASSAAGRAGWPLRSALVGALLFGAFVDIGRAPEVSVTLLGFATATACLFGLLARSSNPERLRGAVSASFGLVHGLGFAGALAAHPIATSRLVPALVGFNVGVEVGQLAAVAAAWFLLSRLGARDRAARDSVSSFGNAAACAAGVFWAITRLP